MRLDWSHKTGAQSLNVEGKVNETQVALTGRDQQSKAGGEREHEIHREGGDYKIRHEMSRRYGML